MKKAVPEFEGIEAYLMVQLECNQEEVMSTTLREGYETVIGLSENELWEKAYQNLCEDSNIQSMTQIMNELMGIPMSDMDEEDDGMYVISNKSKYKGASAILYRQFIEEFANRRKVKRVFILPSSILKRIFTILRTMKSY